MLFSLVRCLQIYILLQSQVEIVTTNSTNGDVSSTVVVDETSTSFMYHSTLNDVVNVKVMPAHGCKCPRCWSYW